MIKEYSNFKAIWNLKLISKTGEIKQEITKENLIVNSGYDLILDCLFKSSGRPNALTHIAIGTNNTAPADSQTTLLNEIGTRVAGTYNHTDGTKVATITGTFTAGNPSTPAAIVEAGLFNASSGGVMFNRVTFNVINKEPTDSLTITITLTLT